VVEYVFGFISAEKLDEQTNCVEERIADWTELKVQKSSGTGDLRNTRNAVASTW
jgi:hypothetical protein